MTDPKKMPERIYAWAPSRDEGHWGDDPCFVEEQDAVEYIRADLTPQFEVDAIEVHLLNIERDWGLKGAVHTHVDHIRRILTEATKGTDDD